MTIYKAWDGRKVWEADTSRHWTLKNGIRIHIYKRNGEWGGSYEIPEEVSTQGYEKWGEEYAKRRQDLPKLIRLAIAFHMNPKLREVHEKLEKRPKIKQKYT